MNKELRVGVIVRTHGIRGEVKVYPTTDSPDRFDELTEVIVQKNNHKKYLKLENVRHFKNLVILKFEGIDDIADAEPLKGCDVFIDRKYAAKLEEGEFYIGDIIGLEVIDDTGIRIGKIKDVMETGANDVYLVERDEMKDLLLPAIKECILDTDIENNVMTVHLMDGLLDL